MSKPFIQTLTWYQSLFRFLANLWFSLVGGSTARVGAHMGSTFEELSRAVFFFLVSLRPEVHPPMKKKEEKNSSNVIATGLRVLPQTKILLSRCIYVLAGVVCGGQQSCSSHWKKNISSSLILCCWNDDLCSSFNSIVAVFGVARIFCLLRQVPAGSSDGSISLFCSFSTWFLWLRRVLLVASLFCLSPASFYIFRRSSGEICFQ